VCRRQASAKFFDGAVEGKKGFAIIDGAASREVSL
jgi:hypothetical protein